MFSGFIFDVEGTLVDSVPQNLQSLQDALELAGYRLPFKPSNFIRASMVTRRCSSPCRKLRNVSAGRFSRSRAQSMSAGILRV
jgi:beta-phosphoglucomutase-like phosphatase (HAD superfamily)